LCGADRKEIPIPRSLFIHSGGQSGNVLSPHYDAFIEARAKGDYIPMATSRRTLEAKPHETLRLIPLK